MVSLPLALLILEPYHMSKTGLPGHLLLRQLLDRFRNIPLIATCCFKNGMFFFWLMVVYHGISWYIMVYHGISLYIIVYHCQSWFAYFLAWLFDSVRRKRTEEQSLKLNCIVLLVTSREPLRCVRPRGGLHQNCPMLTNDPIHWFSRFNPCGFVPFIRCEIQSLA